jgi:hypothetical protein
MADVYRMFNCARAIFAGLLAFTRRPDSDTYKGES